MLRCSIAGDGVIFLARLQVRAVHFFTELDKGADFAVISAGR